MQEIIKQFISLLALLYSLTGNLGSAIILFTLLLKLLMLPLSMPAMRVQRDMQQKMKELQPELDKLKKKHKDNKQAMQAAQLELYKKYNLNPLSGCLPQLLPMAIIIVLYQALIAFLHNPQVNGVLINTNFLWLNLTLPDQLYVLPIATGVIQLVYSLMIAPGAQVRDIVPNNSKQKEVKKANEKEEDMAEMASSMQKQMVFLMPIMTAVIALRFPSGLALYWLISTLFTVVQQYFVSGWGGLMSHTQQLKALISPKPLR